VNNISNAEVTNISAHGFWLLLTAQDSAADQEVFLPFDKFPWFRSATITQITQLERPSPITYTGPYWTLISQSTPSDTPRNSHSSRIIRSVILFPLMRPRSGGRKSAGGVESD
jgi:hypothetical protein